MIAPALTLNHVAIAAPEIEKSVAFYKTLGFSIGFKKNGANQKLELVQMKQESCFIELVANYDAPKNHNSIGPHLGLVCENIETVWAFCTANQMPPHAPPQTGKSGVLWFFVTDPADNLVEFTQALA